MAKPITLFIHTKTSPFLFPFLLLTSTTSLTPVLESELRTNHKSQIEKTEGCCVSGRCGCLVSRKVAPSTGRAGSEKPTLNTLCEGGEDMAAYTLTCSRTTQPTGTKKAQFGVCLNCCTHNSIKSLSFILNNHPIDVPNQLS